MIGGRLYLETALCWRVRGCVINRFKTNQRSKVQSFRVFQSKNSGGGLPPPRQSRTQNLSKIATRILLSTYN